MRTADEMAGMQNTQLIYVAGNPDNYPLEYYDPQTQSYQGVIPALLQQFAQERGYTVAYYQPGREDSREALAQSRQVDLISSCSADEQFSNTQGEPLVLFQTQAEGNNTTCQIFFTDIALASLRTDLQAYAAGYTQADWTEMLLEASVQGREEASPVLPAMVGAGVALCLLAALFALLWRRSCRRLKRMKIARLTDPDTGLQNENGMKETIARRINRQNRALYYLVYYHFELGHLERLSGQDKIREFQCRAAEILRRCAGVSDVLARTAGGDLMVLRQAENLAGVRGWAETALQEMRDFLRTGGDLRSSDAAAGIYPLREDSHDPGAAIFHARQCAFAARRDRIACKVCGGEQCRVCQEERQLLADFDRGLEREEFQLCFQFFVDANTYTIVGGEALSRWNHPRKGLLHPGRFVPLLEQEDRISRLDFYNLKKSCAFLEHLAQKQVQDFFISCNFSRKTFAGRQFVETFRNVLEQYHFVRKLLILEITESEQICAEEEMQMLRNIVEIRALGVRIMFDDFGMGFSSFHDLQEYPMDGLKLDKCLVDNMGTDRGRIILTGLVRTGHEMGMTVLAEGVENDQQVKALQQLHCDVLQGFRFSVPLPADEAEHKILERVQLA